MSAAAKVVAIGVAAGVCNALTASAWQLASRHAATTTLDPFALSVLRYCVPALLLLPLVLRTGLRPAGLSYGRLAALVLSGGLPFAIVGLYGARHAPVAHMGILLASMIPVFTSAMTWVLYRDKPSIPRWLGILLILASAVVYGQHALATIDRGTIAGDLLFLLAGAMWAAYSIAVRASGLTAWQVVAVVNAWSGLLAIPLYLILGGGTLLTAPIEDVVLQGLMQGVVSGLLGLVAFGVAIRSLGPAPASAFAALVPILSAAGGAVLLAEPLTPSLAVAAVLAAAGVVLASGLIRFARREAV